MCYLRLCGYVAVNFWRFKLGEFYNNSPNLPKFSTIRYFIVNYTCVSYYTAVLQLSGVSTHLRLTHGAKLDYSMEIHDPNKLCCNCNEEEGVVGQTLSQI